MTRNQYVRLLGIAGVLIVLAILLQFSRQTGSQDPSIRHVSAAIITSPTPKLLSNDILVNFNNPVNTEDDVRLMRDQREYGAVFSGTAQIPALGANHTAAVSDIQDLDVFASSNPHIIIAINRNKSTNRRPKIYTTGIKQSVVEIWRMDLANQGSQFVTLSPFSYYSGKFTFELPANSATLFVLTNKTQTIVPTRSRPQTVTGTPVQNPNTLSDKIRIVGISQNQKAAGTFYIEALSGVKTGQVDFYVDDVFINRDYTAPFNMGTFTGPMYVGYNTGVLAPGQHTLRVEVKTTKQQTISTSIIFFK